VRRRRDASNWLRDLGIRLDEEMRDVGPSPGGYDKIGIWADQILAGIRGEVVT
jgi:hypothetical protein